MSTSYQDKLNFDDIIIFRKLLNFSFCKFALANSRDKKNKIRKKTRDKARDKTNKSPLHTVHVW